MSTILNELVKIREKLDSDGTYSGSNAGVSETVTQIRELVENGAGGGSGSGEITVYKVAYNMETYEAYVDVTSYSELLEKAKKGLVLFIDDTNELSCLTYIVGWVDDTSAVTLYPQNGNKILHTWTYTNGKYVLANEWN